MPDAPRPTEIVALLRLALRHGDDPNVRACLEAILGWLERQAPVVTETAQSPVKPQCNNSLAPSAFLTVRMAAEILGVSRQAIYNLINGGELLAGRTPGGGAIRIKREDLDAFIARMFDATPRIAPPEPEPEPAPEPPKRTRMKTIFRPDGTPDIAAMVKLKAKMRQRAEEERWLSQDGASQKEKPK